MAEHWHFNEYVILKPLRHYFASTQQDEIEAAEVGAVAKLCKPFTLEELLDCVAAALGR